MSSLFMAATSTSNSFCSVSFKRISENVVPAFRPTITLLYFPPKLNSINPLLAAKSLNHHKFLSLLTYASFRNFDDAIGTGNEDYFTETEEEAIEELKVSLPREVGRLYVGNLPYSMTASQLSEIFSEAGGVQTAEIVYDRVTDRSRGFAFVTMESVEDAKEAIRMFNGAQVGGRTVKVNFPEVPRGGEREVIGPKIRNSYKGFIESPHKIYAGNLDWSITSQSLGEAFADRPGFLSAKVTYERDSGRSRGFGFVSFASAEDAEATLNTMNGQEIGGRPLRLNLASERARPTSPSAREEQSESSVESSELLSSIGNRLEDAVKN